MLEINHSCAMYFQLTIPTRTSLRGVHNIIQNLVPEQRTLITGIGMGSLLEIRCKNIHNALCEWLINRFDYKNCTLNVHEKVIPITTKDVEIVLGLSCTGLDVSTNRCIADDVKKLSIDLGFQESGLTLSNLKARLMSSNGSCDDNFKRCFILYMLGAILCPTTGLSVKRGFLRVVQDVSNLSNINWSKMILQELITSVKKKREKNQLGLRGCIYFLMVSIF